MKIGKGLRQSWEGALCLAGMLCASLIMGAPQQQAAAPTSAQPTAEPKRQTKDKTAAASAESPAGEVRPSVSPRVETPESQPAKLQRTATRPMSHEPMRVRLGDMSRVYTGSDLPAFGYGLVIGLEASGDSQQVRFTVQSVANMLKRLGVDVTGSTMQFRNVAAVIVTASLSPHLRQGDRVDVTVSAIGDARSLQGGILLQTPLTAADGRIYAVAQGPLSIGGFVVQTGGQGVQKNHPTVGRVPLGAILQQAPEPVISEGKPATLDVRLFNPDYTNAIRIVEAVNSKFSQPLAKAVDNEKVEVQIPSEFLGKEADFIAQVEQLEVTPQLKAKVVVNERTGTVIIGGTVHILPVVVSHGSLRVEVQSQQEVYQPNPLAGGQTVVVPQAQVKAEEEKANVFQMGEAETVEDLVRALNAIKITPRDLIAILQALKNSGALMADLEIM